MITTAEIATFVANNKIVLGLVATAGIVTMPPPGTPINWRSFYQWIFDWVHQFLNLRRPTMPAEYSHETPANPKH